MSPRIIFVHVALAISAGFLLVLISCSGSDSVPCSAMRTAKTEEGEEDIGARGPALAQSNQPAEAGYAPKDSKAFDAPSLRGELRESSRPAETFAKPQTASREYAPPMADRELGRKGGGTGGTRDYSVQPAPEPRFEGGGGGRSRPAKGESAKKAKPERLAAAPLAKSPPPTRPVAEKPSAPHAPAEELPDTTSAESYRPRGTNPFVETAKDHLSTFSIDVDTASYTRARKYLNRGQLPPADAVRVEEFVNFFKYYYKSPEKDAFAIYIEGAPSRFGGENHKLLKIGIKGREIKKEARKDALLTFVIDVSGSMRENAKLEQAKQALYCLIDQMREGDQIGIITYNNDARVILDPCSAEKKEQIVGVIRALYPGGSTNAHAGLRLGYNMAVKNFDSKCINRIIFCSDGVANVGSTTAEAILDNVKSSDTCGIYLTTVGFGVDNYNDRLLEKLADKGDGNYIHVDTPDEAKRAFCEELTGTLQVIAKDVKIQVDFDPEIVKAYRLIGYENRAIADNRFRDDSVDAGEVGAGHSVTALYEVELHEEAGSRMGAVHVRYKDPETEKVTEVKSDLLFKDVTDSFYEASENFRLAALVAEFAEVLRGSRWARSSKLSFLHGLLRQLAPEFDNRKDVVELISLVEKAAAIRGEALNEEAGGEEAGTSDGQSWLPPVYRERLEQQTQREPSLSQVLPLFLIAFGLTMGRVVYVHGFRRRPARRWRS